MPFHPPLLAMLAVLLAACGDTEPLQSPAVPSAEAEAAPDEGDPATSGAGIVGTWVLVAQEGYPEDWPGGVEQRLVFYADGRMTLSTQADGETTEQEMQYRLEGDQLVQAMGVGAAVARASRWAIEGDRLTIEQPDTGQRDVYRRVR